MFSIVLEKFDSLLYGIISHMNTIKEGRKWKTTIITSDTLMHILRITDLQLEIIITVYFISILYSYNLN